VTEGHKSYEYNEMLERITEQLKGKIGISGPATVITRAEEVQVVKIRANKVSWQNFHAMVTAIDRKHEHMMNYVAAELGTEATLGMENNMILVGKF
jgi:translation initiation factor 2 subunit 2